MKGWEFTGTHQPLKIVEKPDPKAKPGYVVLKTLAGDSAIRTSTRWTSRAG